MTILTVTNLGKSYKQYDSQLNRFLEVMSGGFLKTHKNKWVLENINLEIFRGQSLGIVGRNGAGKSTLLKIIAGTTKATDGSVSCNGRIAAILELGMGFDQELSGRQNAIIGLHLLGFNGSEIGEKVTEIEKFSELDEYFNLPIRIYSSGMLVRLAFSIATSSNPDLLIVDEALSVGDARFQQKCAFKIEEYKKQGGTLLFVSHDPNVVKNICDKAILLEFGRIVMSGLPRDVIDFYQSNILILGEKTTNSPNYFTNKNFNMPLKATSITTNGDAELIDFKIQNCKGEIITSIESEEDLFIEYIIKMNKYFERPAFGLIIRDRLGCSIYETSTYGQRMQEECIDKDILVTVKFKFNFNLFQGQYSFSVGVSNKGYSKSEFEEISLLVHDVWQIQVLESSENKFYGGVFNMKPEITLNY